MLPAFINGEHFPRPDLLICSTGAVCDDFSAIAQRLEKMGFPIVWWEMPRRRDPEPGETACVLPGGLKAPQIQVECVREELARLGGMLGELAGQPLDSDMLAKGIRQANHVRRLLAALRQLVYGSPGAPLPALEMLVAEMLAIHYCSDREETSGVLTVLLAEAQERLRRGQCIIPEDAVRVFWVNPVADLRAMNLWRSGAAGFAVQTTCSATRWISSPKTCRPWRRWLARPWPTRWSARRWTAPVASSPIAAPFAPRQWWSPVFPAQATVRGKGDHSRVGTGGTRPAEHRGPRSLLYAMLCYQRSVRGCKGCWKRPGPEQRRPSAYE